ncbi:F-box domain-containing protein [Caenorhabditis elegans]|uniref:F-box domain-containing protein n=1 Tax=Caenorhabditis elegans TaxID=6239 RepID=F1LIL9_CAEEL|nr:F-box domain-containing protein [Caenorhabditis elegans]CCD64640.1 F-box domain-containing protein [Caenorhabditis elegans]|eukprot:NP_001254086.1 Uncharacterized protein CELE_F31D5.7 [Caenorhabditis elegans]
MSTCSTFEFWNLLPEEMKLECIKNMSLITRCLLRSTSQTERRLVNSQKIHLHCVLADDRHIHDLFVAYTVHSTDERGIGTGFESVPNGIAMLSSILQISIVRLFVTQTDQNKNAIASLIAGPSTKYHITRFRGFITSENVSFFEKCADDCFEDIRIVSDGGTTFPVALFLQYPSLKKVRKWSLSLRLFPDLGQAVCRRWINTDAEVDSTMTFKTEGYETLDSFVAELQDFVIVEHTNTVVRIQMENPEKHVVLTAKWYPRNLAGTLFGYGTLKIVPADLAV